MAVQDYELLLRVRADLNQAIQGLNGLKNTLGSASTAADAMGKGGKGAADGLGKMADGANKATTNAKKLSDQSRRSELDLKRLGEAIVAAFAVDQLVEFGKKAVEVNLQYQQAFYTLEAATGSAKKSGDELEYVRAIAEKLGLEYLSTAKAYARLVAAAKNNTVLKDATHSIFEGVASATTVLHLSADETQSVLLAIEQMMSKGRVQTQELVLQLGQRLPGAFELAATALGTNTAQLTQWLEQGKIASDQFLPRFAQALQQAYGPSSQQAAKGLNAEINRLKNAVTDLYVEAGKDSMGPFTDTVRELTTTLKDPGTAQGFNLFISGLAKIATAAVNALSSVSKFTNFIGQEIARRQGNFSLDDTAGIEGEISRRREVIANLNKSLASWLSIGSRDGIRQQIQDQTDEVARLQTMLQVNQRLMQQAPKGAAAPSTDQTLPTLTVFPDFVPGAGTKAGGKTKKAADHSAEYADANNSLIKSLQDLQGELDPTVAIWIRYNAAVEKANADAELAKKAKGANVDAIDAQRNAVVQLQGTIRDAALDKLADKDREAWEKLRDSLRTPAEVKLDNAIAQIKQLNDELARGVISSQEYSGAVQRIGAGSVTDAPSYQGLDASVGGVGSELTKNFAASDELEKWHQEQMAANERFREQDGSSEEAYQARLAAIQDKYAKQRNVIESSRQQLQLTASSQFFGQLAVLSQSSNSKIAAIGKAAAISKTIIDTYQSATAAYASLAGIPYIGPALGAAAAAAAIAAGLANVAQIRSQPTGGGGYMDGGYTGPGAPNQPAGIVHAGEVVFSQRDVARAGGVAAVEALRLGGGYAQGGFVRAYTSTDGFSGSRAEPSPEGVMRNGQRAAGGELPATNVFLVMDQEELADKLLNTRAGERNVVQHVGNNPRQIQGKWQS